MLARETREGGLACLVFDAVKSSRLSSSDVSMIQYATHMPVGCEGILVLPTLRCYSILKSGVCILQYGTCLLVF